MGKSLKCPGCSEEFNRVGILAAHYRHRHTKYEKHLHRIYKELTGNSFSRWCLARQQARAEIEAEVEAAIVKAGGRDTPPPPTSANVPVPSQ